MANASPSINKHVIRIFIIYLVAAAVQDIAISIHLGAPHGNWGVLVIGGVLTFWAIPPMAIYQLLFGNPPPHILTGVLWFFAAMAVVALHLYRIEIAHFLKRPNGTTGV